MGSDTSTGFIPYAKPSITELEVAYATDATRNGWGAHCYDYIFRFEDSFRRHLGVAYAIATSSCTGALHMGMHALGIGPGDEVIMADINWVATAAPIVHLGGVPVFVDILPDTWCLDPVQVEAAITEKTKAIVAVHLYGNLCEMDRLMDIGDRYGIPVIEDAAEAIGSIWRGRRAGSIGCFGTFSFHGTKTITTGEGGMFVTNDRDLYERVLTLSNHGRARSQKRQFWPDEVGFKYKMSNVQAAIGCAQLERVEQLIQDKRTIFLRYRQLFSSLPVRMNPEYEQTVNGFWMPTFLVDESMKFDRSDLLESFHSEGIDGRCFFWPLSSTSVPGRKCAADTGVSEAIHLRGVNLPSYSGLSDEDVMRITMVVSHCLSG